MGSPPLAVHFWPVFKLRSTDFFSRSHRITPSRQSSWWSFEGSPTKDRRLHRWCRQSRKICRTPQAHPGCPEEVLSLSGLPQSIRLNSSSGLFRPLWGRKNRLSSVGQTPAMLAKQAWDRTLEMYQPRSPSSLGQSDPSSSFAGSTAGAEASETLFLFSAKEKADQKWNELWKERMGDALCCVGLCSTRGDLTQPVASSSTKSGLVGSSRAGLGFWW